MKYRLLLILIIVFTASAALLLWGHKHPRKTQETATKSSQTAKTTPTDAQSKPSFDKHQFSIDDPSSPWVVVNKKRPLNPLNYAPSDLTSVGNGQTMRAEAASSVSQLFVAAKTAGYAILAESGYRSYQQQVLVYNHEVQTFGQAKADTESAKPGYSEHQTGWAVDIQTPGCLEDCFAGTPASTWLKAHAHEYGFILRYAPDKVAVTGYRSEPWHYRYVGKPLAAEIYSSSQTLEEFFGLPAVGAP